MAFPIIYRATRRFSSGLGTFSPGDYVGARTEAVKTPNAAHIFRETLGYWIRNGFEGIRVRIVPVDSDNVNTRKPSQSKRRPFGATK